MTASEDKRQTMEDRRRKPAPSAGSWQVLSEVEGIDGGNHKLGNMSYLSFGVCSLFMTFVLLAQSNFAFGVTYNSLGNTDPTNQSEFQQSMPGFQPIQQNRGDSVEYSKTALLKEGSQNSTNNIPSISDLMTVIDKATTNEEKGKDWSMPIKLVIIFTGLAILPSLLVMMTSFTRIVIVLSFVRRALTTQTIPPTIAIIGLALFLTLYTMAPTYSKINSVSIQPYLAEEIDFATAGLKAGDCIKEFMLRQSRKADLSLFVQMAKVEPPKSPMDIKLHIVIPAFIISEFRTAFEIGCLLFIPFLLVDMVIAGVLLSAGMIMLPPVMISLPFKLILFILVDGWGLLAKSLSLGFR